MACEYIYDLNGVEVRESSVPELLSQVIQQTTALKTEVVGGQLKRLHTGNQKHDIPAISQFYKNDLTFYNSSGQQVSNIIRANWQQDANGNWVGKDGKHDMNASGEKVTGILKSTLDGSQSREQTVTKSYLTFCKNLGSHLHKLVEISYKPNGMSSSEYTQALQDLKKLVTDKHAFLSINAAQRFSTLKNKGFVNAELVDMFINKFVELDTKNEGVVERAVTNLINTIQSNIDIRGKHVMNEVPIRYVNGDNILKGVMDMLVWDDDGNVTIYDFKTSSHKDLSLGAKKMYYFQLLAYREMLSKLGMPIKNIKIKMVNLSYSSTNDDINFNFNVIEEENMGVRAEYMGDIDSQLIRFFPREGAVISPEVQRQKDTALKTKLDALITPTQKKRSAKESLKNYITRAAQNGNPLTIYSKKNKYGNQGVVVSKWTRNGDRYSAVDSDNKTIIDNKTIDEIVEMESQALEHNLQTKTVGIAATLRNKQRMQLKTLFDTNADCNSALMLGLEPYLAAEWEVLNIPQLLTRNIIPLYDRLHKKYSFVITTDVAGLQDQRVKLGETLMPPNATILHPLLTDSGRVEMKKYKEFRNMPTVKVADNLVMEVMLTISEFADVIQPEGMIEIDKIQVISTVNGTHTLGVGLNDHVTALHLLEHLAITKPDGIKDSDNYREVYTKWNQKFKISNEMDVLRRTLMHRVVSYKLDPMNSSIGLDPLSSMNVAQDIDRLQAFCEQLKHEKGIEECLNSKTDVGRLYAGAQQLLISLKRDDIYTELNKQTKFGLTAAEVLGAGFDLLKYGESRRYSFNGMIVAGMAQGLDNSVSYASYDKEIRYFQQAFSAATSQVQHQTVKLANEVNRATQKFHKALGISGAQAFAIGNTEQIYIDLFEHTPDGKLDGQMMVRNPFTDTGLTPDQQEYLGCIIWNFAKFKFIKEQLFDSETLEKSWDDLKQDHDALEKFKDLVHARLDLRQVPLVQHDGVRSIIGNFTGIFSPVYKPDDASPEDTETRTNRFFTKMFDHMYQDVEPLLLTPEQKQYQSKDFNPDQGNFMYHSPYNIQGEHRVETLNKHDTDIWMKNLNVLSIEYAASQFKEIYYNQVLQAVGNALSNISLMEMMTGQDLTDTKEALINRVKISIFTQDCVKDELKSMSRAVASLKQISSLTKIAVRPALFVKEMVLGVIKNMSTIWAENLVNDYPVTFEHFWEAAKVVYTNGLFSENAGKLEDETFGNFRLVNSLNNIYRINDRDLNNMGDSLAYDHHGVLNIGMRMLYINTTSPDWFNRMTMLVAKMMADGSWEAHRVGDDGNVQYDAGKDERYKAFVNHIRNVQEKGTVGDHEPKDEAYIKAKALYTLKIQQLKREGYTDLKCGEQGKWSLNLPVAYTTQEMDSFKEQIGILYGYYSHEERTIVQKGISWLLHTQFLTFLPAEVRKYVANGNFESCVGKTIHQIDPISKEKLYYKQNDEGLTELKQESELHPEERTDPVYEFTFSPVEGLLVSTLKTVHDVFAGDFNREEKPEQWNRTKLFLFNTLFALICQGLLGYLAYLGIDAHRSGQEYAAASIALDTINRVSSEMLVTNALIEPIFNLGIVGTDFLKSATSSVGSLLFNGDYGVIDLLNAQLPIIKDTHLI